MTPSCSPLAGENDSEGQTAAQMIAKDKTVSASMDVIRTACSLLEHIHRSAGALETSARSNSQAMLDSRISSVLYPLLDLLLLEGVYPDLSPNVGLQQERQKRSLLCNRLSASFPSLGVISEVLKCLNAILLGPNVGIHGQLRNSFVADLIAANTDLSFSPSRDDTSRSQASIELNIILESIPIADLYPLLTLLIRPAAPDWFRANLTKVLSLIPLRDRGVRHTIEYLASYQNIAPPVSEQQEQITPSSGPYLSPEAINQATRVLTSVPKSLTANAYFARIVPQLISLLDGDDGQDLSRAAALIITNGILSAKSIGAPGTIGWELVVAPQHRSLNPSIQNNTDTKSVDASLGTVVSQQDVHRALQRLFKLVSSNPNPALTGRLLRPLLLPLWGIFTFERSLAAATQDSAPIAGDLLSMFLRRCGKVDHLVLLSSHLLWDGDSAWTFGPGSEGGLAIRARHVSDSTTESVIEKISSLERHVSKFLDVMGASELDNELISGFWLRLSSQSRTSKLFHSNLDDSKSLLQSEDDPLEALGTNLLIQGLLDRFSNALASTPDHFLDFINQQLIDTVGERIEKRTRRDQVDRATLLGVSSIVDQEPQSVAAGQADADTSEDFISSVISFLSYVISSKDFNANRNNTERLRAILSNLRALADDHRTQMSRATLSSAKAAITIIEWHLDPTSKQQAESLTNIKHIGQERLSQLNGGLSSDLAPERTAAIREIEAMIDNASVHFDVPTLALLLLNQIRTDSDEFVFLAAIRTLSKLATQRDAGFVVRTVADAFQDVREKTGLEGRLRLGEALSSTIEALTSDTQIASSSSPPSSSLTKLFHLIAGVCCSVAGRRGTRSRENEERVKAERIARLKKRQAEKAWGGEVPDLSSLIPGDDDDMGDAAALEKAKRDDEHIQRIVSSWEDTQLEEDVRLRTSALAILATVLERAGMALTAEIIATLTDLALAILSYEAAEGKAILRRAAVYIFMAHLRALSNAGDQGGNMPSIDGMKWLDVQKILKWVSDVDGDDLVREHARTVLESLEALRMNQIVDAQNRAESAEASGFALGQLRGLSVQPGAFESSGRPKVEILD
jgi:hypothetical protein